ncbi:MAG: hypothetical protein PHN49_12130, partial [Candidatus Omnitrophica bacterium]|nr:hypothetical protein [Candidatus Omnitrophota bacterium]
YSDDQALSDFLWRISGKRLSAKDDLTPAKSRLDEIVERVQTVLDMHPENFQLKVRLYPKYTEGRIASYKPATRTIMVFADRVTDGVFAHEVAHAVLCDYFGTAPSEKVQEILSQYVDRNLWEDY